MPPGTRNNCVNIAMRASLLRHNKGRQKAQMKRSPVFKICAKVVVWNPIDRTPRPVLMVAEECLATSMPNRCDMKSLLFSTIKGKLSHFGIDTSKVDLEVECAEYFAAQTRNYSGSPFESSPNWVPAVMDMIDCAERTEAIKALTYLPYDAEEQRTVYGA